MRDSDVTGALAPADETAAPAVPPPIRRLRGAVRSAGRGRTFPLDFPDGFATIALHLIPTTIIMSACCTRLELVFANLLLRLWIGLRLFMAGLDKFRAGEGPGTTFNLDNYEAKTARIAQLTWEKGFLPEELCKAYAQPLGYLLMFAGAWVVIGLFSRLGLLFAGFMFLSLGVGLATLPDDTEVVLIGMQVLICAAALATNAHNKISLDGLFFRGKKSADLAPPAGSTIVAE